MCETCCAPKKCETVNIVSNEHPSFLMTNVISSTSSVVAGLLGCSAPAALARKMRPSMEDTSVASSKSFPRTTRRCSQMEISVFSFEHGKLHAKTVEILLWHLKLTGNSIWSCIVSMFFHKKDRNRPHRAQHLEFPKLEWNSWTQKNTISLVYSVHFLTVQRQTPNKIFVSWPLGGSCIQESHNIFLESWHCSHQINILTLTVIFFGKSLSHLAARVQSIWPSFKQRLLQGFHITILRHIHFQETWCNWLNLDTRHCKVDDSVFLVGKALKGGDPQMWLLHRCMINNAKKNLLHHKVQSHDVEIWCKLTWT